MAQSASRDDGISLPPPPYESASSSTLRSVQLERVAMALQQNSAADFLQQTQPSSMATAIVQHQLAARLVFLSFSEMFIVLCLTFFLRILKSIYKRLKVCKVDSQSWLRYIHRNTSHWSTLFHCCAGEEGVHRHVLWHRCQLLPVLTLVDWVIFAILLPTFLHIFIWHYKEIIWK